MQKRLECIIMTVVRDAPCPAVRTESSAELFGIAPKGNTALMVFCGVLNSTDVALHVGLGHCTMTITASMEHMHSGRQASRSRSYLVKRAEQLALAYIDRPLQVSALSRSLGVSERTLRKLFNEIYGRPPSRHLRMLRLSQVRGALLSARGQLVTVTEIATDFGFAELGRFSVEYRKVFGESPSETLHQARVSNTMNASVAGGNVEYPIWHR
jgi:AraC-like DNA-binding protein